MTMKSFITRYPLILSLTLLVMIKMVLGWVCMIDSVYMYVAIRVILAALMCFLMKHAYHIDFRIFDRQRFMTAMKMYWPALIYLVASSVYRYSYYRFEIRSDCICGILRELVHYASVGAFEETFFRGVLANCIFLQFQNKKHALSLSLVMSGVIFGAVHILSDIDFSDMIIMGQCLGKTLDAGLAGVLLLMIYWKTQSIFCISFCHFIYDFLIGLYYALFWGPTDITYSYVAGSGDISQIVRYGIMSLITLIIILSRSKFITKADLNNYKEHVKGHSYAKMEVPQRV